MYTPDETSKQMVGRSFLPVEEEMSALRRYSSKGPGYPLSHDMYPTSRAQHIHLHDRSSDRRSPENDSTSRPRSRIPVACGRCRKRKIKCSGDNGGRCTNCKQAQHEQCEFLRVSSHQTQMKAELSTYDFDTSSGAGTRMGCRVPVYGQQSYVQNAPLPLESPYQYRSNSLSSYQFPPKSYYSVQTVPPFSEFSEGGLEYDIHGTTYQVFGADHMNMSSQYASSRTPQGWNTASHLTRNALFIDQSDVPYGQSQIGYQGTNFPIRTSMNPESRSLSLNSAAAAAAAPSLPTPLTVDRMLPVPAAHRPIPVAPPFHRSPDNVLPVNPLTYQTYQGDYLRSNMKSQHMLAVSENGSIASSYLPISSSSPESIASSQLTYGSQQISMSQQQQQQQREMYTPSGSDSLYATESSDSSYGHSSSGSKRGSHSSQTSQADASPLPSIAADTLANGQRYVPYHSPNYPIPSLISNISSHQVAHQSSVQVDN